MRNRQITKNVVVSISLLVLECCIVEIVVIVKPHSANVTLATYFALLALLVALSFEGRGGKVGPRFLKLKDPDAAFRDRRSPWVGRMGRIMVAFSAIQIISGSSREMFLANAIMSGIQLLLVGLVEVLVDWNLWSSSLTP